MIYSLQITDELIALPGCPIERAITQQTPFGAHVGCHEIILWKQDWEMPRTIQITYNRALDFIARRDARKSVRPFQFDLEVID